MKKEVFHTNESDAIGDREILFACMFSSYNTVWITYYFSKIEAGYSCGILCKPRQTPLTAEQWQQRVKQLQSGKH